MSVLNRLFNFDREESINEVTIYVSKTGKKEKGIHITIDGSGSTLRNFELDPYFKVYDHRSIDAASHETRVSIIDPKYVYHKSGLPHKDLDPETREQIDELFSDPKEWKKVVDAINNICNTKERIQYEKPDFTEIKEGKKRK